MAENKRYYWLQLKKDFFKTRAMKKLRSIAGGDTYTIIYLKMQLLSLENGGFLFHEGVEEDMLEEVALDIDESIDNVKITFQFLEKCSLIEIRDDEMYLPEVNENMGSETASAQRVRRFRARRDEKALPCNNDVISGNVELEKELELYKKSKSYKEGEKTPKVKKEQKHKYGEYKHVLLTDTEYGKLRSDFPSLDTMIVNLDEYIETTGKAYKNHNLVMRKWAGRSPQEERPMEKKDTRTRAQRIKEQYGNE